MQFSLQGNLVSNITLMRSASGTAWAYVKVATDHYFADGSKKTAFISLKVFGEQAELAASRLGKGDLIKASGHIESSTYEKDGKTVYELSFMVQKGALELLFKSQIKAVETPVEVEAPKAKKPRAKKSA